MRTFGKERKERKKKNYGGSGPGSSAALFCFFITSPLLFCHVSFLCHCSNAASFALQGVDVFDLKKKERE